MKLFPLLLLLGGCASVPSASAPVTGQWGGVHIGLTLDASGGQIAYDCAAGTIGPLAPDSAGRFTASGTHTPGHGGPVREGEVMPTHAATFAGTVRGDTMTLQGRIDTGVELGPFTLRRGGEAGIFRCL